MLRCCARSPLSSSLESSPSLRPPAAPTTLLAGQLFNGWLVRVNIAIFLLNQRLFFGAMALARPMRALLLAAIVAWCIFLYQIFKPSGSMSAQGPGLERLERDPNLDRMRDRQLPPPPPVAMLRLAC